MSRGVSVRAIGGGDKLQTKREIEMGDTQRYFRRGFGRIWIFVRMILMVNLLDSFNGDVWDFLDGLLGRA